jgi:hypothetical protein
MRVTRLDNLTIILPIELSSPLCNDSHAWFLTVNKENKHIVAIIQGLLLIPEFY